MTGRPCCKLLCLDIIISIIIIRHFSRNLKSVGYLKSIVTDSEFLFLFNCAVIFVNNKQLFEAVVYFGISGGCDGEFI